MGRLALLATLVASMGVFAERGASAASLPLVSGACGPGDAWRCYSTGAVELVTDLANPHAEWTIDLEFPADPENWRLIYIEAGFSGVAQYTLTYPDSSYSGRAQLTRIAFDDSTDLVLAATDRTFLGFCAAGPGRDLVVQRRRFVRRGPAIRRPELLRRTGAAAAVGGPRHARHDLDDLRRPA